MVLTLKPRGQLVKYPSFVQLYIFDTQDCGYIIDITTSSLPCNVSFSFLLSLFPHKGFICPGCPLQRPRYHLTGSSSKYYSIWPLPKYNLTKFAFFLTLSFSVTLLIDLLSRFVYNLCHFLTRFVTLFFQLPLSNVVYPTISVTLSL